MAARYAAREPISRAVGALVSGKDRIGARLETAAGLLLSVKDDQLPPGLIRSFHSIEWRLIEKGDLASSLQEMSEEDAARLAAEIFRVFVDLERMEYVPGAAPPRPPPAS